MPQSLTAIFITALLCLAPVSGAQEPGSYLWWCTLSVSMEGMPRHFLWFGRDAWEGQTVMTCKGPGVEEQKQNVEVAFYSKNSGFGARVKSRLNVEMVALTNLHPTAFEASATVVGLVNGNLATWQIEDGASSVVAQSTNVSSENGMANSLGHGTWSIRAPHPGTP